MIGQTRRRSRSTRNPPGAVARDALFLIETIVPADPGPDWSKLLDVHMLTLLGGKQRTFKNTDVTRATGLYLGSNRRWHFRH